jgi:RND family efflux transporter MFP subunit
MIFKGRARETSGMMAAPMKAIFSTSPRKIAAVASVVVLVAVATFVYLHGGLRPASVDTSDAEAAVALPPPTVAVMQVSRRNLKRTIVLSSELNPYDVVKLYAKEPGYLKSIDVDYGSHVTAGETMATLELPEQAADLDKSDAAYGLAQADYERVASVNRQEPGLIAQADIDKARADYLMAQDQRVRASVVEGYSVITAPFDGVVTKRYVDPGALIEQGTTSSTAMPIVEVADVYRLRLVLEAPESLVPLIHVGMPVSVSIQATGETFPDRVARFSYDVHQDTRTMHTEVDVENADLHLKPGMYASASIDLESRSNAISVPTQAISTEGTPNVWAVDRDGLIQRRDVTLGLDTPDYTEVKRGLAVGDLVFLGDRTAYTVGERVTPKLVAASTARA